MPESPLALVRAPDADVEVVDGELVAESLSELAFDEVGAAAARKLSTGANYVANARLALEEARLRLKHASGYRGRVPGHLVADGERVSTSRETRSGPARGHDGQRGRARRSCPGYSGQDEWHTPPEYAMRRGASTPESASAPPRARSR